MLNSNLPHPFGAPNLQANYQGLSPNSTAYLRTASAMFALVKSNTSGPWVVAGESPKQRRWSRRPGLLVEGVLRSADAKLHLPSVPRSRALLPSLLKEADDLGN